MSQGVAGGCETRSPPLAASRSPRARRLPTVFSS